MHIKCAGYSRYTPTASENKLSVATQYIDREYCAENAFASKHFRLVCDAKRLAKPKPVRNFVHNPQKAE